MEQKKQTILNNVKQKFASIRELCTGITDYISLVANNELVPSGLVVCLL